MFVNLNWNKYPNYFNNLHNRITNRNFCLLIKYIPTWLSNKSRICMNITVLSLALSHPYLSTLIITGIFKTIRHREKGEGIFGKNQINLMLQDDKEGGITKLNPDPKTINFSSLWIWLWPFFTSLNQILLLADWQAFGVQFYTSFGCHGYSASQNQFFSKTSFSLVKFNFVWNY